MLKTGKPVLSGEYLQARGEAFRTRQFMDPAIADFIDDTGSTAEAVMLHVQLWLAFMAGSDWERKYRGVRYVHETTGVTPHLDMNA